MILLIKISIYIFYYILFFFFLLNKYSYHIFKSTAFPFNVIFSHNLSHFFLFEGKINPGENQKVIFSVRPATPTKIAETFSIKIAHFENVYVTCYCVGIFPSVVATLPRQKKTGIVIPLIFI